MSKITFRADDDLIAQLEELDASKSEVMREALRAYLDDHGSADAAERPTETAIDDLVRERVDDLLTERLGDHPIGRPQQTSAPQDVNVTISLEGGQLDASEAIGTQRQSRASDSEGERNEASGPVSQEADRTSCVQCGEHVDSDHVYCPNCGEKASRRLFCDCGDEVRSDWAFCPSCGRRTPAADVLDSSHSS